MSKVDTKPFMLQVTQHKIFLYMLPVIEILILPVNAACIEDLDVLCNLPALPAVDWCNADDGSTPV